MTSVPIPALGTLSTLPLELRYMVYEYLSETYICHVLEPVSLFQTNRHDPCIPLGFSRTSKTTWLELQQLQLIQPGRALKIHIRADGWLSNVHPSLFRSTWTQPSLSYFQNLHIVVHSPPKADPAQALLTRRNIISFATILSNSADPLPPTILDFSADPKPHWNNKQYRRTMLQRSYLPHDNNDIPANLLLFYHTGAAFLHLRKAASVQIRAPEAIFEYEDDVMFLERWQRAMVVQKPFGFYMDTLPALPPPPVPSSFENGNAATTTLPPPTQTDRAILVSLDITSLILDKLLDDLPGPTASRLRSERRRNWIHYTSWFDSIVSKLDHSPEGRTFMQSDIEEGYIWADDLMRMTDRTWRRSEERRDEDWMVEKEGTDDVLGRGVSTARCFCGGCKERVEDALVDDWSEDVEVLESFDGVEDWIMDGGLDRESRVPPTVGEKLKIE
ncbi:hypothetical protein K432DRAFT_401707 [Lepidopterella palustris CBS 459.81]|uniref:Uncharacterized protein n=1 Tax=Lepidopterella palustris CBS 459.81 TaxID=1314670 RepID=A0A8E2EGY0_9PEZI|nr:hypothetical protein K432DRAFT_401707 [Lepidopterella palustris CBS 459.81]